MIIRHEPHPRPALQASPTASTDTTAWLSIKASILSSETPKHVHTNAFSPKNSSTRRDLRSANAERNADIDAETHSGRSLLPRLSLTNTLRLSTSRPPSSSRLRPEICSESTSAAATICPHPFVTYPASSTTFEIVGIKAENLTTQPQAKFASLPRQLLSREPACLRSARIAPISGGYITMSILVRSAAGRKSVSTREIAVFTMAAFRITIVSCVCHCTRCLSCSLLWLLAALRRLHRSRFRINRFRSTTAERTPRNCPRQSLSRR